MFSYYWCDIIPPSLLRQLYHSCYLSVYLHQRFCSDIRRLRTRMLDTTKKNLLQLHKHNYLHSPICHQCHQISSHLHWTTCLSNQLLYSLIDTSLQHILNTNSNNIINLHNQIKLLSSMTIHSISDLPSVFSTLTGLIPNELINIIAHLSSKKAATTLVIKCCSCFFG